MSYSNDTVQTAIDRACANLEATAQDLGINLTFDASHITDLEEVLLAVREIGDASATSGACFMAGAYVGEILRRAIGGQWTMSADGVASLQLPGNADRIFPIEKARKFVQDPAAESLDFYTRALLERNLPGNLTSGK
jgi:hypothetical protein